jgi:hypothetical protein
MTRRPSDAEIWAAINQVQVPVTDFPKASRMAEALTIAAVSDLLGIEPERVRDVIAMRATTIGVG